MAVNMQVGVPYGPPGEPYSVPPGLPIAGSPSNPPMTGPAAMPEPPPIPPPAPPVNQPSITPTDVSAIESAVSDAANIGAQGVARPTLSSEARQRATNISRILEQQLLQQARPGFGDIISAALQTIQKPGQVDFASALRQAQGQDLTRAYNIANALSGLERRTASQELTPRDMLRIITAQADRGDRRMRDLLTNIDRAAQNFEDPIAARETLLEAINKFDAPNKTATQVMQEAVTSVRQSGLPIKTRTAQKSETGATGGGPVFNEKGELESFTPWTGDKLSRDEQAANTHYKSFGAAAMPGFFAMQLEKSRGAAARADVTKVQKMKESIAETSSILRLTDSIARGIAGGAAVGGTAMLQSAVAGVADQIKQLSSAPIKYGEGANTFQTSVAELKTPLGVNLEWSRITRNNDSLKGLLSWVEKAPDAQAIKTNMLLLSFAVARSIDPGGRLSNKDVEGVLMALGQAGSGILTDRNSMLRAMKEVENYTLMRVTDRYEQDRSLYEKNNVTLPKFRGEKPAAQQPQTLPTGQIINWNANTGDFD